MLSNISLELFKNSELLPLLCISFCALFILKIIFQLFHFKRHFYLVALTLVYAIFIFHDLGTHQLAASYFDPIENHTMITLEVDQPFNRIITITGEGHNNENNGQYQIYNSDIEIDASNDLSGPWYYIATLNDRTFFKYDSHQLKQIHNEKYIRLNFQNKNSILNEIWFLLDDEIISTHVVDSTMSLDEANKIVDEQAILNLDFDYQNETYFDEVYHVRNAYEILNNEKLYTATHPLFGTRLIALGMKLFGVSPFGFRFFGALFSVMLVPLMYSFLKEFFKKDAWPLFGATLFALDFMPFATGRIGTLEPFSVFFIVLMFKLYFKALKVDYTLNFKKHITLMAFTGIAMSIAIITKWTAVYGAFGMGIIYILVEGHYYLEGRKHVEDITEKTLNLILFSILFFVLLPIIVYIFSFYHLQIYAETPKTISEYINQVISYNIYSFEYHSGLTTTHPFSSKWYMWLFDIRPIWYYVKRAGDYVQSISCFNNPAITIPAILSAIYLAFHTFKQKDFKGLIILITYLSELVPWIFISRASFAYHYYPCLPFIILIFTYVLSLFAKHKVIKKQLKIYLAIVLTCFIIFMPAFSGFKTTKTYINLIEVLPTWKFE